MTALIFLFLFVITCPSPPPFILAAVCHEGAHVMCALFLGMGLPHLRLCKAWLRLEYKYTPSAVKRILLCLSGPSVGIILGLLLHKFQPFSFCSVSLGIINLLPISVFDGGGALREVCLMLFMPDTAWRICRFFSVVTVILLWVLSAVVQISTGANYSLLFLSTVLIVTILADTE